MNTALKNGATGIIVAHIQRVCLSSRTFRLLRFIWLTIRSLIYGRSVVDHTHDYLRVGVSLLEILGGVGDLLKRKDAVNHHFEVALFNERSQF